MIGKTISHYRILEKLGEGGMGVVYKAEDTKLKRFVALKFLPPELTRDSEAKTRFINEAQAASALQHNNVSTIHEIDEIPIEGRDQIFICMDYYDGEPLNKRLKSGAVKTGEALNIAIQVAQGLEKAHRKGIVHRDIKPGNVIVTEDGVVKIVDFGLAKLSGQSKITRDGTKLGTAMYMSPEQAHGQEVDLRSDIWSLGVVIYEMVTGEHPFKGEYDQAVLYSIINEEPESITSLRTTLPVELERIVHKAMVKKPDERYQNIKEILTDLRDLQKVIETRAPKAQTESKPSRPSIAVLPFVNMSADAEQEYFCDGMAEEIINALTHVEDVHVVARTSAFAFKGKNINICEIAKELNVENVLEGSVRKSGNRLRITAQLIKVADGYHLWSEKYDRNMEDIFDIQDEISLAIVDNLKVKLFRKEKQAIVQRHTEDLEAYNLYLKGRYYTELLTPKGFEKAIECFEKALQKDRNFALAYVGLGIVQRFITLFGNLSPNDVIPKMRAYAEKALEIDRNIGEAHCLLAVCHMSYDWDWPAAEEEFKQALNLNPNSSYIHTYHSIFFSFTEKHDEAVAAARRARELDPLSIWIDFIVGQALYIAGRYDESIKDLQVSLTMNPNYYPIHYMLGYNYWKKAMPKKALTEFEKANNLSGGVPLTVGLMAGTLYEMGKKDRAKELLESLEQRSKREYIPPVILCLLYRNFGNSEKASEWLEIAYTEHDGYLCWCRVMPDKSFRIPPDPRLTEKLKKEGD